MTKEYKVNDFITVRLEKGHTNIYVNEKFFMMCKSLLLNVPQVSSEDEEEISSIDEAKVKLEKLHGSSYHINPEEEFFGHCSNLQVWADNEYDTRLLHSNLAFPLLLQLVREGDTKARRMFKEEIIVRFQSGFPSTILYLLEGKYLDYFTKEEVQTILDTINVESLTDYRTRIFYLILKELYELGFDKPFSGEYLSLLSKDEYIEFLDQFIEEFQSYSNTKHYYEVLASLFARIFDYPFDKYEQFPLASSWKDFFTTLSLEAHEKWLHTLWNLAPAQTYFDLIPVFNLSFIHTQSLHTKYGNLSSLVFLFTRQQKDVDFIYRMGDLFIKLLFAIEHSPLFKEFSNLLKDTLEFILLILYQEEDLNTSPLVEKLTDNIQSLQDENTRDVLNKSIMRLKKQLSNQKK